ncbi:MAG: MFS transporter, partial [Actinobacteria bacterium]|nr:MFS transporter [Actinomycetota bacterium]
MSRYRALLARPGALRVAAACAAGWLSFSSYGFAIVLAVRAATGSFQLAGAASALFAAGSALLAPARGRAVDRLGWPALAGLAAMNTSAMTVLAVAGSLGWASWLLLAAAAVAGAAAPPLIATARACWPRVAGPELART